MTTPSQDDTISIEPLVRILRRYQRVLAAALVVAGLGYAIVVLGLYLWLPRERFASLAFQLRFEGASLGRYPNDLKFSSADILADLVVQAVFERNQLGRFGRLQDFQENLFVVESNPELELLDAEYRSRLADTRISLVDRQRIEGDYRLKRLTLQKVEFVLMFRQAGSFDALPRTLVSKILHDTLNEWAKQAVERRGVLKYDIAFPAAARAQQELGGVTDVYAAVEALRQRALWVDRSIDRLAQIPGSSLVRVGEYRSLADISNDLERTLRFYIEPLNRELTTDPGAAALFRDALRAATLNRDESKRLLVGLQDSLRLYEQGPALGSGGATGPAHPAPANQAAAGAVAPQVSESFLDRIVQLSNRAASEEYRQKLTERILDQNRAVARLEKEAAFLTDLAGAPSKSSNLPQAVARLRAAERQFEAVAAEAIAAYDQISQKNLAPATALFAASRPVGFRSESRLSASRVLLGGVLLLLAVFVVGVAACAASSYLARRT